MRYFLISFPGDDKIGLLELRLSGATPEDALAIAEDVAARVFHKPAAELPPATVVEIPLRMIPAPAHPERN